MAVWMIALSVQPARAHAVLIRAEPTADTVVVEPPDEIRLWFDEPVSSEFSSAKLFDLNSQEIALRAAHVDPADPHLLILKLPELTPGVYSVLWKVLSESDGHFSQGLQVFGVGEGTDLGTVIIKPAVTPPPAISEVALRWLNFTLLASVIGGLVMVQFVLLPVSDQNNPALNATIQIARRRMLGWAGLCAILALLVGGGLLWWQTAVSLEALPEGAASWTVTAQILAKTRWGGFWLGRQILLLLLTIVLFIYVRMRPDLPYLRGMALLLALGWLLTQSMSSHASATATNTSLAIAADGLHLLAASIWVGGLLSLAVGLLPLLYRNRPNFTALVRAGWGPFGRIAAVCVGLLIATGLYNSGRQVASLDALITTLYGQTLLIKVALVLMVGLLGLLNSMLLHPHLVQPLARLWHRPVGWTPLSLRWLPALVIAEVSLGLIVLLLTGLVTAAPAPRNAEFSIAPENVRSSLSQRVDDLVITLSAQPNRPGQNVFTVFAASTLRPAPAEISRVILRFTYLDEASGQDSIIAEEVEDGRFLAGSNNLSLAGNWQIDVVVRRLGMEDSVARFDWLVAPAGAIKPVVVSKQPLELTLTLTAAVMILLVLVTTAVVHYWPNLAQFLKGAVNRLKRHLRLQGARP